MRCKEAFLVVWAVVFVCASGVFGVDRLVPGVYPTIQAGINAAGPGDVVVISPGTYTGVGNRDLDFGGRAVTVTSMNPDDPAIVAATIIDCENMGRGFKFHSGEGRNSIVSGLTITRGISNYINPINKGGGIYCEGSSPTILNCVIKNNRLFRNAPYGGGICCWGGSSPLISSCIITDNRLEGADVSCGSGGWDGCSAYGGGIYSSSDSSPVITGCYIAGNEVEGGEGAFIPEIYIYGEGGNGHGGGVYCQTGSGAIVRCSTIVDNITIGGEGVGSGAGVGGGICGANEVLNCIVWDNHADNGAQLYDIGLVSYSDIMGGYAGIGNIDTDPCFVDIGSGDYHLLPWSGCVDMGDPCYVPEAGETDIDGEDRVSGERVDIGADELSSVAGFIEFGPEVFHFYALVDEPNPSAQSLYIYNSAGGILNWHISHDCNWIELTPNSGSSSGELDVVSIGADITGLSAGYYSCELVITAEGALNSPQFFTVDLVVFSQQGMLFVPSEYTTIQEAIDASFEGDTIVIEPNVYTGSGNKNLDFGGKAITVTSVNPDDPCVVAATVIDCENSGRGFYFHSGEGPDSIVSGITITRGQIVANPAEGGGIYCSGSSPTIKNCVIVSNQSLGSQGDPHGADAYGGGVYCESNSHLSLIDCTVSSNGAVGGHGDSGWCSPMSGCDGSSGNGGRAFGGGLYGSSDSNLTIVSCIISDNSASGGSGGALFISGEPFSGADGGHSYGGGIYSETITQAPVHNCTIADNSALGGQGADISQQPGQDGIGFGGGIYGNPAILNSIVWGNHAFNSLQIDGAATCSYSDIEDGWAGVGNIDTDPCFVSGPLGDYYLSQIASGQAVDSPCVDSGSDLAVNLGMDVLTTRTDEVNDVGIVDMGYHYSAEISGMNPADTDFDGDVDWGDFALFAYDWWFGDVLTIAMGDVNVDGDPCDWPVNVEWRQLDEIYYQDPNDVSKAEFALLWDPNTDKVYALVVVQDSDHVFLDEYVNWDASDRIEVYSQGDAAGGTGWSGIYDVAQQYMIGPNTTDGFWGAWGLGETTGVDECIEYAVSVVGDEIVYEIGVQMFDNYGGFSGGSTIFTELDVGDVVGFDLVADTRWSGGFGMLSENLMTGKYNDAGQFARYLLVEHVGCADLDGDGLNTFNDVRILCENWLAGK